MTRFGSTTPAPSLLLRAAWVAPMDGPVVKDAGIVFRGGRIAVIGGGRELARRFPDIREHDLGSSVVLPGLVNAHTHLELTRTPRPDPPGTFVEWLMNVIRSTDGSNGSAPDGATVVSRAGNAAVVGAEQSLQFGVTCVGDVTAFPAATRMVLAPRHLRVVSYGEVRAMGARRELLDARLAAATDASSERGMLRVGVSPHAPYSVEEEGYRACLRAALERGLPLATHLAETPGERAFLENHEGPLRALWEHIGGWDESVPRFAGGPIRFAQSLGLLEHPTLLAHVNYCDDEELDLLAGGKASVVYCPRTHTYFGHPPHRWREMLDRGINVAVGTDSCASSPDLNVVADLRLLHHRAPEVEPFMLWKMVTERAARAVGMAEDVGTLSPGKVADCTVYPTRTADPLREVLESEVAPSEVWVGGKRVVRAY